MTTGLGAQTVYWGDQPGQGDFDGGLNGWVSNTVSTTGIDTTWEWVANGMISGGVLSGQNVTINSPTASNGAMVFNGDKFSNAADGIPDPPYPQYVEELVSPTIDLSAVPAGTALAIEFSQVYYWFQAADGNNFFSSYSISTDDGMTWSDPRDCNTGAPAAFANSGVNPLNNTESVRIPVALDVAGSSTVRIKFTFAGNYYYWALDDIKITERPGQDDMAVAEGWYATSSNKMIPVSQLEEMVFMTDVENFGGNTAENVVLNMSVIDDSGTEVYSVDENYGTLIADSLDENRVFGAFTPTALGDYTATYEVSADSMDENPVNNTLSFTWEVTEEVFAKETGPSSVIQPADSNWEVDIPRSWTYGNHFYVVNGSDIKANFAEFVINNADDAEDIPVYIKLYKWDAPVDVWATDPDASDYTCAADARTLVGRGTHIITGDEDDDEFVSVELLDELSLEQGVTLEDNTHYILMIELIDSGSGDDANVVELGASREVDYAPTNFAYQQAGMPRFGSMIGLNGSGSVDDAIYNSIGFGQDIVPVLRLIIGEPIIDNSSVEILEDATVTIFPSPADKDMTVDIELAQAYDNASVSIIDASGKMLSTQQFTSLQSERISYNTTNWTNGTYFLRVATKEGVKTKNFVVQH